jgi:polysaccharide deacetylase family protein (PEP-CTERM system associated)
VSKNLIKNAMTVDVEDYFHVSAFSGSIDRAEWGSIEPRVYANTMKVLELLEHADCLATFFILGWVAERDPRIVKEIAGRGHEVACHGFSHELVYKQSPETFRAETARAKSLLEDICGQAVIGYRAASFSITSESTWAIPILAELGFRYDSSIVPVSHDLYGIPNASAEPHKIKTDGGKEIAEFPPSTVSLAGLRLPVGGGGYFRLFPYWFTRWALSRIHEVEQIPFSFYLHPWEVDTDQPRVRTNWKSRFRHYQNLGKSEVRFKRILNDFEFDTMASVLKERSLGYFDLPGAASSKAES